MATPAAIATKIQRVKYLSKNVNLFLACAGAQLFADIVLSKFFNYNNLLRNRRLLVFLHIL